MVVSKKTARRTVIVLFTLLFICFLPFILFLIYRASEYAKYKSYCDGAYRSYLSDITENYDRFSEFSDYLIEKGECDYYYEYLEGEYSDMLFFHEPEIYVLQVNGCDYVEYRMAEREYGTVFIYASDPDSFRPEQIGYYELDHEYENIWGDSWVGGGGAI